MRKIKVGVIIGRFQTDHLHEGHLSLFQSVLAKSDEVIVLIGSAKAKTTNRNPLDYETRKLMISSAFPGAYVGGLRDFKSNAKWSKNVDKVVQGVLQDQITKDIDKDYAAFELKSLLNLDYTFDTTLYGCRDSFIPYYEGTLPTEELTMAEVPGLSATQTRALICKKPIDSSDFRAGVIYGIGNDYPKVYSTVDVAIMDYNDRVLLGRKEFETEFRFIGGFVDPTDETREDAARREVGEEVGNIQIKDMNYICSQKIDDWRYRGTQDGIMTDFYITKFMNGTPTPQDDIFEVKFFPMHSIHKGILVSEHEVLLGKLKEYLDK